MRGLGWAIGVYVTEFSPYESLFVFSSGDKAVDTYTHFIPRLNSSLVTTMEDIARSQVTAPPYLNTDKEFAPIRGRGFPAPVETALAGRQPAGRSAPSLIAGDTSWRSDHVRARTAAIPIASLINYAIPRQIRALVCASVNNLAVAAERWSNALGPPRDISGRHRPRRWRRAVLLLEGPPSLATNLPRRHLIARRFGYLDKGSARNGPRRANCRRNSRMPETPPEW